MARGAGLVHHGCSPRALNRWAPPNFARNSPATVSNVEFAALELQRFEA